MAFTFEHSWDDSVHGQSARQLQIVRAGSSEFGIYADEIAAVVAWREPTPLPNGPAAVLGVVSVQGRMLTVLNLAALPVAEAQSEEKPSASRKIVALKGDEQLALAVDEVGETISLASESLQSPAEDQSPIICGVLPREHAPIPILDTKALFPAAIQGRERRRRRF